MTIHIAIIGSGPAGYIAAFVAAKEGAKVTLIEADKIGGTCLNYGCIPTKSFKASANALDTVRNLEQFGILGQGTFTADMPSIVKRKDKIIQTLANGLKTNCQKLNINLIFGQAELIANNLIEITQSDNKKIEINCDKIILATGSQPLCLKGLEVDEQYILSSSGALNLKTLPENILIVGGGVIGCEYASIFKSFGVNVTVVEGQDRLLPQPSIDIESSKLLAREFKKQKIHCELNTTVKQIEKLNSNKLKVSLIQSKALAADEQAEAKLIEVDKVIVTIGRSPSNIGLNKIDIEKDQRGWVVANKYLETSLENVFAVGDILGPSRPMLAHLASAESLIAVQNCLSSEKISIDYQVVPSAIFTNPELASVGLSESQAKEQNYSFETKILQMRELGKSQTSGKLSGFFKLIINKENEQLLGAHIAGEHATELIAELTLALKLGITIKEIANTIHAHPTLSEGICELANM